MAKRYLKQPAQPQDEAAGCMSGFISIFDFSVSRYSQKLLSGKKRGSSTRFAGYPRKKLDYPSNIEMKLEGGGVALIKDGDGTKEKIDKSGMVSIKTLMDEEMSKPHKTKSQNNKLQQSQTEPGCGMQLKEKKNKKAKPCNKVEDDDVDCLRCSSDLDFSQYDSTSASERSSLTHDVAALMVHLYCISHHYKDKAEFEIESYPLSESNVCRKKIHINETDSDLCERYVALQKALGDIAKSFLSQRPVNVEGYPSNTTVKSKELINALKILSSNKEIYLQLIQDPNLILLQHIQDIQASLLGNEIVGEEISSSERHDHFNSNELLQKQSNYKSFRKKNKPKGSSSPNDKSQIVLLRPSPASQNNSITATVGSLPPSSQGLKHHQEQGERTTSYISLKGIKKRLKHVIGENKKEKSAISMDGILDKIPSGVKDSSDARKKSGFACKGFHSSQHDSQPSAIGKSEEESKLKKIQSPCSKSSFYEEAKKHLHDMLLAQDEMEETSTVSSSFEVIYLPDYNLPSPGLNPGANTELESTPVMTMTSPPQQYFNGETPMNRLTPLKESLYQDPERQVTGSNEDCFHEDVKAKGSVEGLDASDSKLLKEHDDLVYCPEPTGCEPSSTQEGKTEGSYAFSELEMPNFRPQPAIASLSILPASLNIEKLENSGDKLGMPEGPSPVSVLEPFFLEDVTSPGNTTANHVELSLQAQQTNFEEDDGSEIVHTSSDFEDNAVALLEEKEVIRSFLITLLQVSGMTCYEIIENWNSSNQFLAPSLLEVVGIMHNLLPDDQKLLFDCLNEVLTRIQQRLFGCNSWVSLITSSFQLIPRKVNLIEEVCIIIDMQLQLSQLSFDQITRIDIEEQSWTHLHFETEAMVVEMADTILEEIIEESIMKK